MMCDCDVDKYETKRKRFDLKLSAGKFSIRAGCLLLLREFGNDIEIISKDIGDNIILYV